MTQVKKRNSLQAVLDRHGGDDTSAGQAPEAPVPQPPAGTERTAAPRPSREGKRLVAGHFPPHVAKQLKILAAEEDKSVQALLEEALDLLFVKKGKDRIAARDR